MSLLRDVADCETSETGPGYCGYSGSQETRQDSDIKKGGGRLETDNDLLNTAIYHGRLTATTRIIGERGKSKIEYSRV